MPTNNPDPVRQGIIDIWEQRLHDAEMSPQWRLRFHSEQQLIRDQEAGAVPTKDYRPDAPDLPNGDE